MRSNATLTSTQPVPHSGKLYVACLDTFHYVSTFFCPRKGTCLSAQIAKTGSTVAMRPPYSARPSGESSFCFIASVCRSGEMNCSCATSQPRLLLAADYLRLQRGSCRPFLRHTGLCRPHRSGWRNPYNRPPEGPLQY